MPLVVFTVFYVPVGLQVLADWLAVRFPGSENNRKSHLLFFSLLIIGLSICTPKLLRPIRTDKKAYISAAQWLKKNTQKSDIIAVSDKRLGFYAERKWLIYKQDVPVEARYVVTIVKDDNATFDVGTAVRKEFSLWVDQHKKTKKFVIYKVL